MMMRADCDISIHQGNQWVIYQRDLVAGFVVRFPVTLIDSSWRN